MFPAPRLAEPRTTFITCAPTSVVVDATVLEQDNDIKTKMPTLLSKGWAFFFIPLFPVPRSRKLLALPRYK